MKLEQQVVSLELATKLRLLGVKQESVFYWANTVGQADPSCWRIEPKVQDTMMEYVSAFTTAELGELLPWYINKRNVFVGQLMSWRNPNEYAVVYGTMIHVEAKETATTEADARAKMLIYLLETGLSKAEALTGSVEEKPD